MNKCILMGRITHDLETKQIAVKGEQVDVLNFTIAVNGSGDTTDFIDCVAWRGTATNIAKYLGKGSRILVEGSLRTRTYEAEKDGVSFTRKISEINVERFEFCDSKSTNENHTASTTNTAKNSNYEIAPTTFEPAKNASSDEDMF